MEINDEDRPVTTVERNVTVLDRSRRTERRRDIITAGHPPRAVIGVTLKDCHMSESSSYNDVLLNECKRRSVIN
jgi:hypothetical protein